MSLFEPLHSEACQAIVGGSSSNFLTDKPSDFYLKSTTNYGQYIISGPVTPLSNPSKVYGAFVPTNYGLWVKKPA